tara:strand:+ start:1266 stop:2426 length:1161 start_codon:yes stop_codon:yes gene_type:complete
MQQEVLVSVEGVGKKFCRDLKRSLWYGVLDIATEIFGKPNHLKLRKDEFWAVNDVSFELRRGECLGLIGHNGAGKSTLLKMLNGLIKPDKGRITMRGRIGALIELGAGFNPILTGRENIYVNGQILGFQKKEIDEKFEEIVSFAEIGEFIDTPVQNYSSGMKVRLGFAVAAQMEPDILIIDEVLAVGDVAFKIKCFNQIFKMLSHSAVIFVSHAMPQISKVCTSVIMLENGRIVKNTSSIGEAINRYFSMIKPDHELKEDEYVKILEANLNPSIKVGQSFKISLSFKMKKNILNGEIVLLFFDPEQKMVAISDSKRIKISEEIIKESWFFETNQFSDGNFQIGIRIFEQKENTHTKSILSNIYNVCSFTSYGAEMVTNASFYLKSN